MNVFEEIESDHTLPLSVKEEMISSLDSFKLIGELVDLFFVKATKVSIQALSSIQASQQQMDENNSPSS